MRQVLIRTGLTFLVMAMMILHFGDMREPILAHALDAKETLRSAASFPGINFSACDPQDEKQNQPATGLHCQFDTNVTTQATQKSFIPSRRAYFPTELRRVGSTVAAPDKPPNLEVHS